MIRSEYDIREKIRRIKSPRAGSIFPRDFEAGWLYGLLWALFKEPQLASREDVSKWTKRVI